MKTESLTYRKTNAFLRFTVALLAALLLCGAAFAGAGAAAEEHLWVWDGNQYVDLAALSNEGVSGATYYSDNHTLVLTGYNPAGKTEPSEHGAIIDASGIDTLTITLTGESENRIFVSPETRGSVTAGISVDGNLIINGTGTLYIDSTAPAESPNTGILVTKNLTITGGVVQVTINGGNPACGLSSTDGNVIITNQSNVKIDMLKSTVKNPSVWGISAEKGEVNLSGFCSNSAKDNSFTVINQADKSEQSGSIKATTFVPPVAKEMAYVDVANYFDLDNDGKVAYIYYKSWNTSTSLDNFRCVKVYFTPRDDYAEVSTWQELNATIANRSGWTESPFTIVLNSTHLVNDKSLPEGIEVKGNILIMPKEETGDYVIDANGKGRIFNVTSPAALRLLGLGSATLTLTGGVGAGAGISVAGGGKYGQFERLFVRGNVYLNETNDVMLHFEHIPGDVRDPGKIQADSFTGYIQNISLGLEGNATLKRWIGEKIVSMGVPYKENFTLSRNIPTVYFLKESFGDLYFAKTYPPYVEVHNWAELKEAVDDWEDTENLRTIVLMDNCICNEEPGFEGILVKGNIAIMPNETATGNVFIDANGKGRIFQLGNYQYSQGRLTLSGNTSSNAAGAVLTLTGGRTIDIEELDKRGAGVLLTKSACGLTLDTGVAFSNCSADGGGNAVALGSGSVVIGGAVTLNESNDILLELDFDKVPPSVAFSVRDDFTGEIANITLHYRSSDSTVDQWCDKRVVENGAQHMDRIHLSPALIAKNYILEPQSDGNLYFQKIQDSYVEVHNWDELNKSVSEWVRNSKQRTIVLMDNCIYNGTKPHNGISVLGNIAIMPNASAKGNVFIDAKGMGPIFNVVHNRYDAGSAGVHYLSHGNLTLCENSSNPSAILHLTGGTTASVGGGVLILSGLEPRSVPGFPTTYLIGNVTISNCSAHDGGNGIYVGPTGTSEKIYSCIMDGNVTLDAQSDLMLSHYEQSQLYVADSFSGKIENLSLGNPSEWEKHVVVYNGAQHIDQFTLDPATCALNLSLEVKGQDLVLDKDMPQYVEVHNWEELKSNVTEWTKEKQRTIVLMDNCILDGKAGDPDIPVKGNVSIMPNATATGDVFINANEQGRIFTIDKGGSLTLSGNASATLNVTGGKTAENGAGVYVHQGCTLKLLDGATISNCHAVADPSIGEWVYGGGVYNNYGTVIIDNGNITGCTATQGGNGIYSGGRFEEPETFVGLTIVAGNTVLDENNDIMLARPGSAIKASPSFTGKVEKISLSTAEYSYKGWRGKIIVVDGVDSAGTFNLSKNLPKDGYHLMDDGKGNLIYSKYMPAYVEVSAWDQLKQNASEWEDVDNARIIVVTKDCIQPELDPKSNGGDEGGIKISGNVTIMPYAEGTVKIDANRSSSVFMIYDPDAVLTLSGNLTNPSATLNVTGGRSYDGGGGAYIEEGTLILNAGAVISNCQAVKGGKENNGKSSPIIGGGVFVSGDGGTLYIDNGRIINCSAPNGGNGVGVSVAKDDQPVLFITGNTVLPADQDVCLFMRVVELEGDEYALLHGAISTSSSFFGMVNNITLLTMGEKGPLSPDMWLGESVVFSGGYVPDRFSLSPELQKNNYTLIIGEGDLVLSNGTLPTVVTVNNWTELVHAAEEWSSVTKPRTIILNNSATFVNEPKESEKPDDIDIYGNIIIKPSASETDLEVTLDGNRIHRIFDVDGHGNLTICGNGSARLNLTGGALLSPEAEYGGGAICVEGNGTVTLNNVTIAGNTAWFGGALSVCDAGTLTINNGTIIRDNVGAANGGGVMVTAGGHAIMNGGDITNNTAINGAGVIVSISFDDETLSPGHFIMYGGNITGNTAYTEIPYLDASKGEPDIAFGGGGIAILLSDVEIYGGNISGNTGAIGAGISNHGNLTIINATISNNTATYYGGGICNADLSELLRMLSSETSVAPATLTVLGGTVDNNKAPAGAGIANGATIGVGVYIEEPLYFNYPLSANTFINGSATVAADNDVYLHAGNLSMPPYITAVFKTNITTDAAFTGNVKNITVFTNETEGIDLASWFNETIVKGGAKAKEHFALSNVPAYSNYSLVVKDDDLVFGNATHAQYTVTYKGNGNTSGAVPVDENKYSAGASVTVKGNDGHLAKIGYQFNNWTNTTGAHFVANDTFVIVDNTTLTANWTANTYTVVFHGNNATAGSMANQSFTYDVNQNLSKNNFTRNGYTFNGWATSATGAAKYSDEQSVINLTTTNKGVVDLYANWTAGDRYHVTYTGNGNTSGAVPVDDKAYIKGDEVTVKGNDGNLAKIGYQFNNWTNASGAHFKAGAKFNIAVDTELKANWTANTYTIVFHGNNATAGSMANQSFTYDVSQNLSKNNFTRTGYTFNGWATSATGAAKYSDEQNVKNLIATNKGIVNLYANWTAGDRYYVTYKGNGNTSGAVPVDTTAYIKGEEVTVKGNDGHLAKTGYQFNNWTNATGAHFKVGAKFNIEANTELKANWTANTYTVVFHGNGETGGSMANQSFTYDVSQNLKKNSYVRDNYTFNGWATSAEGPVVYTDGQSVKNLIATNKGVVNLYAHWTSSEFIVSSNTVSFGTVDLKNSEVPGTQTLTVTNNLSGKVKVSLDNPQYFQISPEGQLPASTTQIYNITVKPGISKKVGDYSAYLTFSDDNKEIVAAVKLTVSIVNSTKIRENTTVVPKLPEIKTKANEQGVITNVTVAKDNVSLEKGTEGKFNATIATNLTINATVVKLFITDVYNTTQGGQTELTLTNTSTITTEYPVTEADLKEPKSVRVKYKAGISLNNVTANAPPTLTGDFNESIKENVVAQMPAANVLSMVSSINSNVSEFDEKIQQLSITFDIPKDSVSTNPKFVAFHVTDKVDQLSENSITVRPDDATYHVTITSDKGFSSYVVAEKVVQPSPQPSHSGDKGTGTSVILTPTPTVTPTVTPTATQTWATPTTSMTVKTPEPAKTATPASPLPFAGILAGLGAAAVLFGVRRS